MDPLAVAGHAIPEDELEERFETWGGPGGQHANRSHTAVVLRFDIARSSLPDDLKQRLMSRLGPWVEVRAGEHRSQTRNRELARERLASRLASALRTRKPRKPTRPTRASRNRRRKEKEARSQTKRLRRRPGDEG
ncbi:MAG: alternative ribosome rescue aminoacyl-tRNA hydrolase ArfB [Actinomycetes bacterium]|nr:MAG: aminoacyl-tRNA hydrolase [Actinomycetota bacterium]